MGMAAPDGGEGGAIIRSAHRCVQCIVYMISMQVGHDGTMDLHRLRHLLAVAEHGNFGRAAAASHITQPALSRSIQALEAEVGAPLLDRRPTGVEPTDMGRLLLRHAEALDAAARDLDREIRLAKGLDLGELRIGVGPWGGAALVAPVIGRLHVLHPRLRLGVVVAPWRELPDRLRARDVDIVVGALGQIDALEEFTTVASAGPRDGRRRARWASADHRAEVTVPDILRLPDRRPGDGRRGRRPARRAGQRGDRPADPDADHRPPGSRSSATAPTSSSASWSRPMR